VLPTLSYAAMSGSPIARSPARLESFPGFPSRCLPFDSAVSYHPLSSRKPMFAVGLAAEGPPPVLRILHFFNRFPDFRLTISPTRGQHLVRTSLFPHPHTHSSCQVLKPPLYFPFTKLLFFPRDVVAVLLPLSASFFFISFLTLA